jgi:von Willebrand factor type A domain
VLAAIAVLASITFVTPQPGAQAIGPQAIEVTTSAASVDRVDFHVDGALAGVARKPPYRIAYDFGTSLAPRTVTAKVWSNGYRTSETATIVTATSDAITIDLVEVPLRVRASRGVKTSDLRVRENGVEQTIRDVRFERPPAHFAFVVDRSLSMGDGRLAAALRAVDEAMKQLRKGDTSSIVTFNHHVAKARPVGTTGTLTPSGGTSLRDAIASVASAKQRTYAIVITDGGDRNSELTDEAALRRISSAKTVVHALVLGDTHANVLDRAAKNTGGLVTSTSRDALTRAMRNVMADINSRYLLVYQSAGTKPGWRTIDVQARSRGVEIVSARKGYFAE